jgi:hypothetical protein
MDLQTLKNLIAESSILQDADRAYWTAQLPTMSQPQLQKLHGILMAAANIRMEDHVREYFSIVRGKTAAAA